MTNEEAIRDLRDICGFDEHRCDVCAWPLQATAKEGCTLGNCSMRDDGTRERRAHELTVARIAIRHLASEARKLERVREWAESVAMSEAYLIAQRHVLAILSAPDAETEVKP